MTRRLLPGLRSNDERQSRCLDKRAFATWDQAHAQAAKVNAHRGDNLEPYRCPYCDKLHLGHPREAAR